MLTPFNPLRLDTTMEIDMITTQISYLVQRGSPCRSHALSRVEETKGSGYGGIFAERNPMYSELQDEMRLHWGDAS